MLREEWQQVREIAAQAAKEELSNSLKDFEKTLADFEKRIAKLETPPEKAKSGSKGF